MDQSADIRFDGWTLQRSSGELIGDDKRVRLQDQPLQILEALLATPGAVVTREQLIARLWPKGIVDFETGLNTAVRKLRAALGDDADAPRYIETLPRRGYRFIGTVMAPPVAVVELPVAPPPGTERQSTPPEVKRVRWHFRLWIGFAVLMACAGVIVAVLAWRATYLEQTRATIAVLPFDNLSGNPQYDYLAEGLAEDAGASLGQVDPKRLQVISRMSATAFKRSGKSITAVRSDLGADYLVESSLRAEGDKVRVTAKLVRVDDQMQLWTASFDRALTSTLGVQRDLANAIAEQIRITLSPERAIAMARRQTEHPKAYDLYLRGRYEWSHVTSAGNRRALEYYEQAIAEDPSYALAWAGVAMVLSAAPINGDSESAQMSQRAREAAHRALSGAPDLAEAHFARAYSQFFLEWKWDESEAGMRRAIELDPNYAFAHLMLGHVLSQTGQHAEARAMTRRARQLDPLFAHMYAISAQVAFQGREHAEALEHARQAMVIEPTFWIGHLQFGQALEQLGEPDRALQAYVEAARYSGGNSKALAFRAHLLAKTGRAQEARSTLDALEGRAGARYVPPYAIAMVHIGLGDQDAALDWLERAYAVRDAHLVFLPVDVRWDTLHQHERYQMLMKRCGFAAQRESTLVRRVSRE